MAFTNPRRIPEHPQFHDCLCLEFRGIPFAKQSFSFRAIVPKGKKFAIVHKYQPKKIVDGENTLRAQMIEQLPKDFVPFTKAVIVKMITFTFPLQKSATKKKQKQLKSGVTLYKTTKPDLTDNLMKGLFDAMRGIVFIDDSQIAEILHVRKVYGEIPGISIVLDEIEEEVS